MYYWQSDTPQFIPEGDWDSERQKYGSYDGTIEPKVKLKVGDIDSDDIKPKFLANRNSKTNQKTLNFEFGYGLRKDVVKRRLKAGWSYQDAFNKPPIPRRTKSRNIYVGCEKFTFVEFARYIGVTYSQLNYKFRRDGITKSHWQEQEVAQLIENWYEKTTADSQ